MEKTPLLGIFDSGVGGFSVYKKIKEASPADVIYYGDCARAPYGNREESELISFIKDDIRFLLDEDVTHFVNACNSMSVVTTDAILSDSGISSDRYTDMIRAFSKHAHFEKDEKVLVLATVATIRSKVYQDCLRDKGAISFEYSFTDLARAIEESSKRDDLLAILEPGILHAKEIGAVKVVYGCTHYPLVHELFIEMANKHNWNGEFIDPAVFVGKEVASWNMPGTRRCTPYSSKDTPAFIKYVVSLFSM